ncbi:hypothetical protein [Peribacillus frigoritolerans]|uniref:hypothetical protein n=1 Tax=Peribacillus frigoritolerans TaxID=450367 RepID=UPI0039A17165
MEINGSKSLRCQDVQKAVSINLGNDHPLLTFLLNPIKVGAAAIVMNNIKGLDVVDYTKFRGIAALKFNIGASLFDDVIRVLEEVELVQVVNNQSGKKWKIYDKTKLFSNNYYLLDKYLEQNTDSELEMSFVDALMELSTSPQLEESFFDKYNLPQEDLDIIKNVGKASEILQFNTLITGESLIHTPLYWENNPENLNNIVQTIGNENIKTAIEKVKRYQGYPIDQMNDKDIFSAISFGILPTPSLQTSKNTKQFAFTPYAGNILTDNSEKPILDKARNLITAIRYGQHYSEYPIKNPLYILNTLNSKYDQHTLQATTVAREQYKDLALQGIGQLIQTNGNWYKFQLFDTPENLKAVNLAIDLINHGEQISNKGREEDLSSLITGGNTLNEFYAIKTNKRKVDINELNQCVNALQGAYLYEARTR